MLTYSRGLQLLWERADFVGWLALVAGVALAFHAFCGLWAAPWLLRERSSEDASKTEVSLGTLLTELLAIGVATNILLWIGALYATRSTTFGTAAGLLAGGCGLAGLRTRHWRSLRIEGWPWWLMTAGAVLLGLWHHSFLEFPIFARGVPHLLYNDLWTDLPVHLHVTNLIGQGGLPLLAPYASADADLPYSPPSHLGFGVWTCGISTITAASPYQTIAAVWVLCRILICWSAYTLLRGAGRPAWQNALLAFVPLVLGGIGWPLWTIGPETTKMQVTANALAGVMSWNCPQAISVALTFAALVLLQDFFRDSCSSGRPLLAALVIVVGGVCKPSLFIFVGPALWIVLALRRSAWVPLLGVTAVFAAGVGVYLLPAWFPHENLSRGWSLHPTWEQSRGVAEFFFWKGSGLFLLALPRIVDLVRHPAKRPEQNLADVPLIAMGGALLFPLLFREEDLVPLGMQVNLYWGAMGCLQLLWPFAVAPSPRDQPPIWRWTRWVGASIVAVQIACGVLFAIQYPLLESRLIPREPIDVVTAARANLQPTDRTLLDPLLSDITVASYLGRPQALDYPFNFEDRPLLKGWGRLCQGDVSPDAFDWDQFEAVVVRADRLPITQFLHHRHWSWKTLPHGFILWHSPADDSPARDAKPGQ